MRSHLLQTARTEEFEYSANENGDTQVSENTLSSTTSSTTEIFFFSKFHLATCVPCPCNFTLFEEWSLSCASVVRLFASKVRRVKPNKHILTRLYSIWLLVVHNRPEMAPQKPKPQADAMKQKSLMSWFGQPSSSNNSNPKPANAKLTAQNVASNSASKSRQVPKTPDPKGRDALVAISPAAMSSRSSDGGLSALDTPPTSDPIDIDMLSAEEDDVIVQPVSAFVTYTGFFCYSTEDDGHVSVSSIFSPEVGS
jgi:hypothetical protein